MTERLIHLDPAMSAGSCVRQMPYLRERYGVDVAEIVETTATMLLGDTPSALQEREALKRISDWSGKEPLPLDKFDAGQVHGLLLRQALQMYGRVDGLNEQQWRLCADNALKANVSFSGGRPKTVEELARMAWQLIALKPNFDREKRIELLLDALEAIRDARRDQDNLRRFTNAMARAKDGGPMKTFLAELFGESLPSMLADGAELAWLRAVDAFGRQQNDAKKLRYAKSLGIEVRPERARLAARDASRSSASKLLDSAAQLAKEAAQDLPRAPRKQKERRAQRAG